MCVCPDCGSDLSFPIYCESCDKFFKLSPPLDFFQILVIEKSFNIEPDLIESQYESLMSLIHPDFFANSSDEELKNLSLEYSSLAKQARDTLLKPYDKALNLFSSYFPDEEKKFPANPIFVNEMFELREELEDMGKENSELFNRTKSAYEFFLKEVTEFFEKLNDQNADVEKAKQFIAEFKFWLNIGELLEQIKKNG